MNIKIEQGKLKDLVELKDLRNGEFVFTEDGAGEVSELRFVTNKGVFLVDGGIISNDDRDGSLPYIRPLPGTKIIIEF